MPTDIESATHATTKQVLMISLTRLALLNQEARRQPLVNAPKTLPYRLIPIRARSRGADRWPLLLIHPVGGSIMAYFDLARHMDPQQPIYAIENQADETGHPPVQSIEQIADLYLGQMRATGIKAPWFLGGYSMGGLVAFEMARQLRAAGGDTPQVIIIDTPSHVRLLERGEEEHVEPRELLLMGKMLALRQSREFDLDDSLFDGVSPESRIEVFLSALKQHGIIPERVDSGFLRHLIGAVRANELAQRRYRPCMYDGGVTLLRARDLCEELRAEASDVYDDPYFGWQQYCVQSVHVRKIPGEHLRIIDEPHCRSLAATLQNVLDAQQATRMAITY